MGNVSPVISEEKRAEFTRLARPLMAWLRDNCNPHMTVEMDSETTTIKELVTFADSEERVNRLERRAA